MSQKNKDTFLRGEWNEYSIDDLASMKYGKMIPEKYKTNEGYPVFSGYGVTGYSSEYLYEDSKVVVVARGVGGTGDVKLSPKKSWVTNLSIVLELDEEKVNKRFLKHSLDEQDLKNILNTGSAQAQITISSLKPFKIKLPPIGYQERVVSIISTFDDLIEYNKRRIEILEEMVETIYREWFVNFNFPGSEDIGTKDTEIGLIPENFNLKAREKIVERKNSREDPTKLPEDTPYVGLGDIPEKDIAIENWEKAKTVKSAKYKFKPFDILFAKLRPYLHKCVFAPIEGIVSTDAFVLRPRQDHYYGWSLMHFSSEEFVKEANRKTKGTNRPRADWNALKKEKVPFPPESLLVKFDKIVRSATSLIQNQIFRNKILRKTRDLLLPRLISGEIDLKGG